MAYEDRWRRLNAIWDSALKVEPGRRDEFVRQACAGDGSLQSELESLLAWERHAGAFLEPPESPRDSIVAGRLLGHYEVLEKLGEGGMGVVYSARDVRLKRIVAIKLLRRRLFADPDRQRRFIREAEAASALNHPNIVTIYEGDEVDGMYFIAMEYVAGKTLGSLIGPSGLMPDQALAYSVQMADALAKAHAAGIVHRDLKPSNIMVTEDGLVKILDFGLAKLTDTSGADLGTSGTASHDHTPDTGVAGTASYMSPEQADGRKFDARSDIFSFGAVLYEMFTGRRAFQGDSVASTMAAVIEEDPSPPREVVPGLPRDVENLILRCLQKEPDHRWQSMADLRAAMRDLARAEQPVQQVMRRPLWIVLAFFAVLLAVIAAGLLVFERGGTQPSPRVAPLTSYPGIEWQPTFSPDGQQVAFSREDEKGANQDIYVKRVGEQSALRLTSHPDAETWPAWSPDGRRIAFQRSARTGELIGGYPPVGQSRGVYLISPLGGTEQKLSDFPAGGQMSWSADGKCLAVARGPSAADAGAQQRGIVLLPADGSEPRRITDPKAPHYDAHPSFSPDGRRLAYASCTTTYSCDIYLLEMRNAYGPVRDPKRITRQGVFVSGIAWSSDGKSLVYSGSLAGTMLHYLWRLDASRSAAPERLEIAGLHAYHPAVARSGNRISFARDSMDLDIWRCGLDGVCAPHIVSTWAEMSPSFSPDGNRVAFVSARSGDRIEIWVADADGSNPRQLTNGLGRVQASPRWSPDGRWIVFDSLGAADLGMDLYIMDANGGTPRRLTWEPSDESLASWSHDGKWIYFSSNRTGRREIWRVRTGGGRAEQITREGGDTAFESADGAAIYYTKRTPPGFYYKPLVGGPERLVSGQVRLRSFAVVREGVYFIGPPDQGGKSPLRFLEFSTGASRVIARIDGTVLQGLTVSPDRQSILFTMSQRRGFDLMLIENFR